MKAKKRLFIALWPDMFCRDQISEVQKQAVISSGLLTGAVAYDNLHMTLLFMGEVPVSAMALMESRLSCVSALPFHVTLDNWGHFPRSSILWIGSSTQTESLQHLQSEVVNVIGHSLNSGSIKSARIKTGKDTQFKPHVTLFRKVEHLPRVESFEPIEWLVDRFVLVESSTQPEGVKYRVLQEYLF